MLKITHANGGYQATYFEHTHARTASNTRRAVARERRGMTTKQIVNSTYGNGVVQLPQKWYRWHKFPLLPIYDFRPRNEHNEADFSISWLIFRVWSMMSPTIGLEFEVDFTGIFFRVRLPYLNIIVYLLPIPDKVGWWSQRYLWRRGYRDPYTAKPHDD